MIPVVPPVPGCGPANARRESVLLARFRHSVVHGASAAALACTVRDGDATLNEVMLNSNVPPTPGDTTRTEEWASAAWQSRALGWVDEHLATRGMQRTGRVEQTQVQPWSTVFSVTTTAGRVWFKAAGPATAFEAPLAQVLARIVPRHVLTPLAIDVSQGWILLPDGGRSLSDGSMRSDRTDALVAALPPYAEMQFQLAAHVPELLALGVPDMRPALMPEQFDQALRAVRPYLDRFGDESERAAYEAVVSQRDRFACWCEQLAASPVPSTLDHGDLRPANVLMADAAGNSPVRFFDWGISAISHPFTSMLIPLRFVQRRHRVRSDDPAVIRARDAYLDAFRDLAPHRELVAMLEAACRLSAVGRSLVWVAFARQAGGRGQGQRKNALKWLTYLLDESYLGPFDWPARGRDRAVRGDRG